MTPTEQDKLRELLEKYADTIETDDGEYLAVDIDHIVEPILQLITAYTNKQIEAVLDRLELSMRGKTIVDTAEGWQKFVKRHVVASIEAERNKLNNSDGDVK